MIDPVSWMLSKKQKYKKIDRDEKSPHFSTAQAHLTFEAEFRHFASLFQSHN